MRFFHVLFLSIPQFIVLTIADHVAQGPQINGFPQSNGIASPHPLSAGSLPAHHSIPPSPQSPVSFTPEQLGALKNQIAAFKALQRGDTIPEHLRNALLPQNYASTINNLEKAIQGPDIPSRIVDAAVKVNGATPAPTQPGESEQQRASTSAEPKPKTEDADAAELFPSSTLFLENDEKSGIYPYNAFLHPFTHLKRPENMSPAMAQLYATRLQRLLVPSIMPAGLDPHQIIAERNRYIDARIENRIRELSALPSTMGEGGLGLPLADTEEEKKENQPPTLDSLLPASKSKALVQAPGKLRAVIELKALHVREKQRALRAQVVERLAHGTLLPLDRKDFRRPRRPTLRDARMTEQLERKQRHERERKVKQKHLEQLASICAHGKELLVVNRAHQDRMLKLGRSVQALHGWTEKEEAKRIERISKERLKALKADDEEAYMKLIDTAKDTRITHLLRQTDTYLDSLAQAVVAQQNDGHDTGAPPQNADDGPTDETMFGAQKMVDPDEKSGKIDYYAVAHRIKETVTKQPSILVGGTLKEYQIKGLQWMVSLYNNKLNGILADEMVRL